MKEFINLHELEDFEPMQGLKAKIMHTETQTFAFWEIEKGSILPEHSHMHEQVSIVTDGELELSIEGTTELMTSGMVANIPANAKHSAVARTKVAVLDVFTPIREDFPYAVD